MPVYCTIGSTMKCLPPHPLLRGVQVSKQSQLESMACEKQALVLRLEKEKRQGQESKVGPGE